MGNVVLVVFNLFLLAMLVTAWQLWRQSVPKRRKVTRVDASDWPSGPSAAAVEAFDQPEMALAGTANTANTANTAETRLASGGTAVGLDADMIDPLPDTIHPQPDVFGPLDAFDSPNGRITDDDLARLLGTAPATASVAVPNQVVPAPSIDTVSPMAAASGTVPPATVPPTRVHEPTMPEQAGATALFEPPTQVDVSAAPSPSHSVGDDVAGKVSTLLSTPAVDSPPFEVTTNGRPDSVGTPPAVLGRPRSEQDPAATDLLRLDLTGRPLADVLRTVVGRFASMGYKSHVDSSGANIYARGPHETLQVSVDAKPAPAAAGESDELPGSARISVVGGQLQETTEAVLFELLDHGFQLRWAVAGELVLSSQDGALARVNVNPAESF